MTRIILLIFSLVVFELPLFAQDQPVNPDISKRFHIGLKVTSGGNYELTNDAAEFDKKYNYGSSLGLGLTIDYQIHRKWGINAGGRIGERIGKVTYSQQGGTSADLTIHRKLLDFPFSIVYTFFSKKNTPIVSVYAGGLYRRTFYNVSTTSDAFFTERGDQSSCSYLLGILKDFQLSKSSILFIGLEYDQQLIKGDDRGITFTYIEDKSQIRKIGHFTPLSTSTVLVAGIKF